MFSFLKGRILRFKKLEFCIGFDKIKANKVWSQF